jgi:hypothetical protein
LRLPRKPLTAEATHFAVIDYGNNPNTVTLFGVPT